VRLESRTPPEELPRLLEREGSKCGVGASTVSSGPTIELEPDILSGRNGMMAVINRQVTIIMIGMWIEESASIE